MVKMLFAPSIARAHASTRFAVLLLAVLAIAPQIARAQDGENVNPINVAMDRFHADVYQPGQAFEVQVRIVADGGGDLTAMGLRESIPPGWTFMGMQGVTGDVPAVSPSPGEQEMLEFAWITVPQLPYTFSYTLQVPEEGAMGSQVFHGALEYRLSAGAQFAAPVITSVNGAPDTQPPVITLSGGNSISIEVGTAWVEPGYSARDNVDGDLTGSVTISGDVNSSVEGSYALNYSVTDKSGNRGSAQRNVTVTAAGSGGGGTGGGGVGGPVTNPRPGTGVGNGTGTSRMVGGNVDDARRTANPKAAAKAAQTKNANAAKTPAGVAADTAAKGGSLQMRPGVHSGSDPASGVVIPGAESTPGAAGAPGPRVAGADGGGATDATEARTTAQKEGRELSDAWPDMAAADAAKVAKLETAGTQDGAPGGAIQFGPKSSTASLLVVATVVALIVIGLGGSMFAARTVYGGRRRRVAPPRES